MVDILMDSELDGLNPFSSIRFSRSKSLLDINELVEFSLLLV